MNRDEVLAVYGEDDFAEAYDERFLLSPWPKHGADAEVAMLADLFATFDDPRWVDLCCGTGYFLSQFPDVERGGLDLSPAMLAQAQVANDGVTFRNADVCVDIAEWHGQWSVVSCMWMAYCYLESMPEVEQLVANMVSYTAEGGAVFLPSVIDLEDLRPHTQIPYEEFPDVWGGRIAVTGYNWTWEEPNGNVNANMMAVHVGHFVRLLEPYFERVEVVRYPLFAPGFVSRKAVVATGRRPAGETGTAEIIWQPIPKHPDDIVAEEEALAEERRIADEAEAAQQEAEAAQQEAEAARQEAEAGARRELERLQAEARAAADGQRGAEEALRAAADAASAAGGNWEAERTDLRHVADGALARSEASERALEPALRSPKDVLTGPLVRELLRRASPSDGRIWVAARRRVAKLLRRG